MHLTCLFLASGTVCNSSLWPYLSPGMPRNSVQLPTNLLLPALTDCLHSRAAERRCLAHQERAEAVVRLWQADRMSKSKLLVRHCSYCFALTALQTSTVCTNMLASSGSPTGTVIQLDPTGSHWESQCVMEDLSGTLPGARDESWVHWRGEEHAPVAILQKRTQNSGMIFRISFPSFETCFWHQCSITNIWVCVLLLACANLSNWLHEEQELCLHCTVQSARLHRSLAFRLHIQCELEIPVWGAA